MQPKTHPTVAIVGAGISGLRCASILLEQGVSCALFDKSRGFGGRTSTRRKDNWLFDHGTGYFSGTDTDFLKHIKTLRLWQPKGAQPQERLYVGTAGSSELAKNIAAAITAYSPKTLSTHLGTTITKVSPVTTKGWQLFSSEGEAFGPFDLVVMTAPPPQALHLITDVESCITQDLSSLQTYCTWALMLVTDEQMAMPDLVRAPNAEISRIIAEHSKPQRQMLQAGSETSGRLVRQGQYVLQAGRAFSKTHSDATQEEITQLMLSKLDTLYGPIPKILHSQAHRWLHAGIKAPLGKSYLFDRTQGLAAAGDWCIGTTAEDAFISGSNLARAIIDGG